ncbi:MAG: hypothetical protein J6M02_05715 [Clostridia bacterium]|nr:hypothetical protein [Clostridia bacterium]
MFVVITPQRVVTSNTLRGINKKLNSKMELTDFKSVGTDFIVNLNDTDLDFIRDMKAMAAIPIRNLYKKDNTVLILCILNVLLSFIGIASGGGTP